TFDPHFRVDGVKLFFGSGMRSDVRTWEWAPGNPPKWVLEHERFGEALLHGVPVGASRPRYLAADDDAQNMQLLYPLSSSVVPDRTRGGEDFQEAPAHPDRRRVVAAWPGLPEHIRRAIVILANDGSWVSGRALPGVFLRVTLPGNPAGSESDL